MPKSELDKKPVELVNEKDKSARKHMERYEAIWREAIEAFQNRGAIDDPFSVNVKVGRLIADLETVIPRDVGALLGSRPYMPIRSKDPIYTGYAKAIEDVLDHFTEQGKFFLQFTDALRLARVHGIGYVEPRWKTFPVNIFQRQQELDEFGRVVGLSEFRETVPETGLQFKTHGPWSVRVPAHGNSLDEKPWIIIAELVHVSEIERLLDLGTYKLRDGKKKEDLRESPSDTDMLEQLRREKNEVGRNMMQDIGLLLRYYSEDRWIHTWNRTIELMDTENQNENMPRAQKPLSALRNISHVGPDRFFPVGMYEYTRDLANLGDKALSMFFDAVMMNSAQWMLYNPDLVEREDLVAEYGNRVPVEGGRFDEAIRQMKVGQAPTELFDLYNISSESVDTRLGLFDYQRGSRPVRKETATTTTTLTEAGNTRLEFGITYIEQTGLRDIGYLSTKIIDANMTDGQRDRILGFERSQQVMSVDPDSIPGGFNFEFFGSARVNRRAQKLEAIQTSYNLVRQSPTIQQPWIMDRKLLEQLEAFTEEELDAMGLTEEAQAPPEQPEQPPGGEGVPPVSQSQAIQSPGEISTPATNVAAGLQGSL